MEYNLLVWGHDNRMVHNVTMRLHKGPCEKGRIVYALRERERKRGSLVIANSRPLFGIHILILSFGREFINTV